VRLNRLPKSLTITGYGLAGILLLGAVILVFYLVSSPHSLDEKEATRLIRLYLKYRLSESYAQLYKNGHVDTQAANRFLEEVNKVDRLRLVSVEVGRLFPDYIFSEWGPTFYAKAVIREDNGKIVTRYFDLGTGDLVVGESSRFLWLFVFWDILTIFPALHSRVCYGSFAVRTGCLRHWPSSSDSSNPNGGGSRHVRLPRPCLR